MRILAWITVVLTYLISLRTHSVKLLIMSVAVISVALQMGCAGNVKEESGVAVFTPEADKQQVKIDPRLMEKCPTINDKLQSGNEEDVAAWAKTVLSKAKDCRIAQQKAAEFLQDTFNKPIK
jgi:hypothetical protein